MPTNLEELMEKMVEAITAKDEQIKKLLENMDKPKPVAEAAPVAVPKISINEFQHTEELWSDYIKRFETAATACKLPEDLKAATFLSKQSRDVYKELDVYATQLANPKTADGLTYSEITTYMNKQYSPQKYEIRERFNYWTDIKRKPGESPRELATRIRQMANKCNFKDIKDPLEEALRSRFISAINNEAVLKHLFQSGASLTFQEAVDKATEIEEASKAAKAQVQRSPDSVKSIRTKGRKHAKSSENSSAKSSDNSSAKSKAKQCASCGAKNHDRADCKFRDSTCRFCNKQGHIEKACIYKQKGGKKVNVITIKSVISDEDDDSPTIQAIIRDFQLTFLVDTGASVNLISRDTWQRLGKPTLQKTLSACAANGTEIVTLGSAKLNTAITTDTGKNKSVLLDYIVAEDDLHILGRPGIRSLGINILGDKTSLTTTVGDVLTVQTSDQSLKSACEKLCDQFPDLWKDELGCLKDVVLDVKFKDSAKPKFFKPRSVAYAMQSALNSEIDSGISKGVWKPVQFNDYGTPVVPVRKQPAADGSRGIRVCGDYSVFINEQLETHRQPMPLPEDLMRKLGGGYFFSKIDLKEAYNQIQLSPESQQRLALSTTRGVLLQMRLPYGIHSAPGYFQHIMNQLTCDLDGVAVYLDDILVSGSDAKSHLNNLRKLLQRLSEKGLRCNAKKCVFAQPSVTYLGHTLTRDGVKQGPKADAIQNMPPPTNVSQLRSFLGSVQFYHKFLPDLSTLAAPLNQLLKKDVKWSWDLHHQKAFDELKRKLGQGNVLTHFDPSQQIGISCDASEYGLGVVLFHRYADGSEKPIQNASKTMTTTQRKYPQIQKEALAIKYAIDKFHQFLYGRKFILVTDHKPLVAMFNPHKGTPTLAANRLSRWANQLHQYDYTIEYRSTQKHGNADALSRLPSGADPQFDTAETEDDGDVVFLVNTISSTSGHQSLQKATNKDPQLSTVKIYLRDGWPHSIQDPELVQYSRYKDFLHIVHDCVLYGDRVCIPEAMRQSVLNTLHTGHFGTSKMKQLARTTVFWPGIDAAIETLCKSCTSCGAYRNQNAKPEVHPWMMPEKPWSRLHIDHAINFMGSDWLVIIDAYSKYPCIHRVSSTSTEATIDWLEEDIGHFGYPHTIVSDNATTFTSGKFQEWCAQHNIVHLTGAPYYPATNGAAERLVQSMKQSLRKSSKPPKKALKDFLMQYRRTPQDTGFSPAQLNVGRQIRTQLDTLLPSPPHLAQQKQQLQNEVKVTAVNTKFKVGDAVYALYTGPKTSSKPKWVPAVVLKAGSRTYTVKVTPSGPYWRRHLHQLLPRYYESSDDDPGCDIISEAVKDTKPQELNQLPSVEAFPPAPSSTTPVALPATNSDKDNVSDNKPVYTRENPRRNPTRARNKPQCYNGQCCKIRA